MQVSSEVEDDVNAPAASTRTLPSRIPATSDRNRQVTRATGVRATTTTRLSLVTPTVGGWAKSEDHSCSRRCGYRGLCRLLRGTQGGLRHHQGALGHVSAAVGEATDGRTCACVVGAECETGPMSHSESSDAVAPSALKHEDEAALIERVSSARRSGKLDEAAVEELLRRAAGDNEAALDRLGR